MRGYVICTTERSGSNYVCRVLSSTGVLGHPTEYFNADGMRAKGFADYPEDLEGQFERVLSQGATANGVYGLKAMPHQFERASHAGLISRLPALSFVSLVRLDVLGQAISFVRARQTRHWTRRKAPPDVEPTYDFEALRTQVLALLGARSRWSLYLACNAMPVLHLFYEQCMASPQAAADLVAGFIGLEGPSLIDMAKVDVTIQRDALSEEWRRRFVAQAGDLRAFPGLRLDVKARA